MSMLLVNLGKLEINGIRTRRARATMKLEAFYPSRGSFTRRLSYYYYYYYYYYNI
jgi:hypothetical protein